MMNAEEIYGVRDRSEAYKAKKSGPWVTDFGEMAKKTVVRRAFKMWPSTDQNAMEKMALAVQLSNEAESFKPILTSPDLGEYSTEQKKYFDGLIENNDALGMRVLQMTISEGEFKNLYHSFNKGEKGKYQSIVDGLCSQGYDILSKTLDVVREAIDTNDGLMLFETLGGLTDDERTCLADMAEGDAKRIIEDFEGEDE
jgi:hypothetical protein